MIPSNRPGESVSGRRARTKLEILDQVVFWNGGLNPDAVAEILAGLEARIEVLEAGHPKLCARPDEVIEIDEFGNVSADPGLRPSINELSKPFWRGDGWREPGESAISDRAERLAKRYTKPDGSAK